MKGVVSWRGSDYVTQSGKVSWWIIEIEDTNAIVLLMDFSKFQ